MLLREGNMKDFNAFRISLENMRYKGSNFHRYGLASGL
jgi:hypothetical protein